MYVCHLWCILGSKIHHPCILLYYIVHWQYSLTFRSESQKADLTALQKDGRTWIFSPPQTDRRLRVLGKSIRFWKQQIQSLELTNMPQLTKSWSESWHGECNQTPWDPEWAWNIKLCVCVCFVLSCIVCLFASLPVWMADVVSQPGSIKRECVGQCSDCGCKLVGQHDSPDSASAFFVAEGNCMKLQAYFNALGVMTPWHILTLLFWVLPFEQLWLFNCEHAGHSGIWNVAWVWTQCSKHCSSISCSLSDLYVARHVFVRFFWGPFSGYGCSFFNHSFVQAMAIHNEPSQSGIMSWWSAVVTM